MIARGRLLMRRRRWGWRARLLDAHHHPRADAPNVRGDRRARAAAGPDPQAVRPLRPDLRDGDGRADRHHAGPVTPRSGDVQGGLCAHDEEGLRDGQDDCGDPVPLDAVQGLETGGGHQGVRARAYHLRE